MFTQQKAIPILSLENIHMVHFTFDMWSSPNNLSLFGLTGHWIAEDGHVAHALLGLRHLHGAHTGENQCGIVFTNFTIV